jgi:predicted esterase
VSEAHALEVRRTARIVTLGTPGPAVRTVWLACHGYGQLAERFMRRFEALDDASRYIVAPEALNRFYLDARPVPHGRASPVGATWMTRADRLAEIDDYVAYLDRVHDWIFERIERAAVRLNVLGFSQGMSTVVRWARQTRAEIDHLVLWAGSWPPEIEAAAALFRGAHVSLVAGKADRSVSVESFERITDKLRSAGLEADLIQHEGGHDIDAATLANLESRPADSDS